jgi:hypothetical protein
MNTKFISWLKQQNYFILVGKWDKNKYRRILMLYTTRKCIFNEGEGATILKYKWGEIVNKNLLSGWN